MAGHRVVTDPRNSLYLEMLEIVKRVQPDYVVMENVEGLRSMLDGKVEAKIINDYKEAGYDINVTVLNSADYGVPQIRKRVIFIGNRHGLKNYHPKPIYSPENYVTLGEGIKRFMSIPENKQINHIFTRHSEKMMEQIAEVMEDMISIDIEEMKQYPELLQGQFLLMIIDKLSPGRKDIGAKHIQDIQELCEKSGTKRIYLPGSLEVVKEYGTLWIKKQKNPSPEDKRCGKVKNNVGSLAEEIQELEAGKSYLLNDGSVLDISLINIADFGGIEEKKYTKYFDYDKINSRLILRFRQSGDYLTVNDLGQKKSLKEYFINEKVPSSIRAHIPLIADENHILWAIGYRISAYYKVTPETKKIIQMTIRRKEHVREN